MYALFLIYSRIFLIQFTLFFLMYICFILKFIYVLLLIYFSNCLFIILLFHLFFAIHFEYHHYLCKPCILTSIHLYNTYIFINMWSKHPSPPSINKCTFALLNQL